MLSVFLRCGNANRGAFDFVNVCCFEMGWCEWPGALCFVAQGLEADVFNLVCVCMLPLDLCTGVGISGSSQSFASADQGSSLLVVLCSQVCAQGVKFMGRGALHDVVLTVLLLFDCLNKLVVAGQSWWRSPAAANCVMSVFCLGLFFPPLRSCAG